MLHIQNWYRKHTRSPFTVHKEKVKRLSKIVAATNAKVVMSSSWRGAFWKVPYEEKIGNLKFVSLTAAQYSNAAKDNTTVYFITD